MTVLMLAQELFRINDAEKEAGPSIALIISPFLQAYSLFEFHSCRTGWHKPQRAPQRGATGQGLGKSGISRTLDEVIANTLQPIIEGDRKVVSS